ncbi:MAG: ParB family chromosome partitioning protein [Myxococcota bacterium]|jgi:ParB family chromosome partitioning protein
MSGTRSRGRLGRGLSALIPDDILDTNDPISVDDTALQLVRLDQVRPNPEQPRLSFQSGALEELATSIREHGVLTPLLVRRVAPTSYILIAGERRLRAAGLAGLEQIPVWVREDVSSREQLELALVENLQREDLDPIETATAYRRMLEEFSMTQAEVARRVGKDRATVANSVRMLRLPEFVLAEVRSNRISAGHAKALLPLPDTATLRKSLREVIIKDLSVRATERMVGRILKPERRKKSEPTTAYQEVSDRLERTLGSKVRIEPRARGKRGKIVIEYFSPEELERLIEHLTLSPDEPTER